MGRFRANETERVFETHAKVKGWEVSKKGWPDFICFGPKGQVIVVECKPRKKDPEAQATASKVSWTSKGKAPQHLPLQHLKTEQVRVLDFLSNLGVRCYLSDGLTLEPYSRSLHANWQAQAHNPTLCLLRGATHLKLLEALL